MTLKNKKRFFISVAAIVFVNLFLLLATYFLYARIFSREVNYFEIVGKTVSFEERVGNFRELEKDFRRTEQDRMVVESVFLNRSSIIEFLELIESLAKKSEIEVNIKSVDFLSQKDGGVNPKFTIKVSGHFDNLYYFLSLIESAAYQTVFSQINIQDSSPNSGENIWEGVFELIVLNYNDN